MRLRRSSASLAVDNTGLSLCLGACPALGVVSAAVCGGHSCSSAVVPPVGSCFALLPSWIISGVPSQCQILYHVICFTLHLATFITLYSHGKLMSATNLHTLTLHQGLMTIQVFLHRKYIPTSTNFSKFFLNSFSEKVLALNFFSSPLYHPPSLPAVYFLSLFLRGFKTTIFKQNYFSFMA